MKRMFTIGMTVIAAMVLTARVADACKDKSLTSLELRGTIAAEQKEVLDKYGEPKAVTVYYLVTANERIFLPQHNQCNGEPKVKFQDYDGAQVTLTARGKVQTIEDGAKKTRVHEIASIQRVNQSATT